MYLKYFRTYLYLLIELDLLMKRNTTLLTGNSTMRKKSIDYSIN